MFTYKQALKKSSIIIMVRLLQNKRPKPTHGYAR